MTFETMKKKANNMKFEFEDAIKNLKESEPFRTEHNTIINNDKSRIVTKISSDAFYEVYDEILF